MSYQVKICGLQGVEVLKSMLTFPIDYIGFVFAPSKRRVTPEQAGEMILTLRQVTTNKRPLTVGVFVNPTKKELAETLEAAPLDVIQLHGQETPDFCQWIKTTYSSQVWKVIPVSQAKEEQSMVEAISEQLAPYAEWIDGVLLDTYDQAASGGTGRAFAWEAIPGYKAWTLLHGIKLFVAGGLHAENVTELVQAYEPDGVDVSSGVETDGAKDIDKIKAFVERVKSA